MMIHSPGTPRLHTATGSGLSPEVEAVSSIMRWVEGVLGVVVGGVVGLSAASEARSALGGVTGGCGGGEVSVAAAPSCHTV